MYLDEPGWQVLFNLLKCLYHKHPVKVDIAGTEVRVEDSSVADGADTTIVLRPESTILAEEGFFPVKVEVSCFMGAYQLYHVMFGDTKLVIHEYNPKNKRIFLQGETAYLNFASENAHCI